MTATPEDAPDYGRSRFRNEEERKAYSAYLQDEVVRISRKYGEADPYDQPFGHLVVGVEAAVLELEERYVQDVADAKRDTERAYRRGYSQAYFAAATDAAALTKKGFARSKEVANILLDHALKTVLPWRQDAAHEKEPERQDAPKLDRPDWFLLRHQTFARDGRACTACGSQRFLEIDHIKGVNEGGLPVLDNLRVLCRTCNRSRPRGPRAEG